MDEKAYWATVVGVEIASTAPGLGDFVAKVLRGGTEIGAVTLSRFYALHTIWLPWLVFGLVGVHLFFVRYYGSFRHSEKYARGDENRETVLSASGI